MEKKILLLLENSSKKQGDHAAYKYFKHGSLGLIYNFHLWNPSPLKTEKIANKWA